jgi:hypothetical protein
VNGRTEDLDEDVRTSDDEVTLTDDQAGRFDMLRPMIESAYREMGELSKKKQDGVVNELKIRHINRLLGPIKEIMAADESVTYLELLDEQSLPQNSDAVFVLGQFIAAMDRFKRRNSRSDPYETTRHWRTVESLARDEEEDDYEEDEEDEE